jgi:hypothetical protein
MSIYKIRRVHSVDMPYTPIEGYFWMPSSTPNLEHPSGAMSICIFRRVHSVDMPYTHQVVILMHFGSCIEAARVRMTYALSPCSYIILPELNQSHMNTPIEGNFWMPSSTPHPEHPSGAMSIYKIRRVHSVDMPYTHQVVILMHFGSCI